MLTGCSNVVRSGLVNDRSILLPPSVARTIYIQIRNTVWKTNGDTHGYSRQADRKAIRSYKTGHGPPTGYKRRCVLSQSGRGVSREAVARPVSVGNRRWRRAAGGTGL